MKPKTVSVLIRMPEELKKRIELLAANDDRSFNNFVNRILEQATKEEIK